MTRTLRIGIQIEHTDPFWVQVREVMWQRARVLAAELIELNIQPAHTRRPDEQAEIVESLIVQELDALIANTFPESLLVRILARNLPIIYVSEIPLRHPRFCSRTGLYDAAHMLGAFLHQRLQGHGNLLIVGGDEFEGDTGESRMRGFTGALAGQGGYHIRHLPTAWMADQARPAVAAFFQQPSAIQLDAIFGLSDSLALLARDTYQLYGRQPPACQVFGINGDPLALAAIADGRMTATIETDVEDIATQAVHLAYRAARGLELPAHFSYRQRLITAENVAEAAMRKMLSLATLPTRLIDVNRRNEQQRGVQREISQAIDRQVGLILNEQQLSLALTALIRDSYGFDFARYLTWDRANGTLNEVGGPARGGTGAQASIALAGPLAYALEQGQLVFIPDTAASHRFAPDPQWPDLHARVVLPVRLGGQIVGLLDLHRHRAAHHTREELHGLQLLADRLGISMRNAELYSEALRARATAEQADQLKTRLLANVSHELRTPLNIILGYSSAAIATLSPVQATPAELRGDLQQIYRAGEHLIRVINDLLDLSRAEINELDLFPEPIDTRPFLADVFADMAHSVAPSAALVWRLDLPAQLPMIQADPVRLRQALLNLLSNAHKFTSSGQIVLGAEVLPPQLHIWVCDTGVGIPSDLQERIFEPFVMGVQASRRPEGVGLGLSITRRLVALHGGAMALESQPEHGSSFHIYLPLPSMAGRAATLPAAAQPALGLIGAQPAVPAAVAELCQQQGWALVRLQGGDELIRQIERYSLVALAWELAGASLGDWAVLQQLRSLPQLRQLPLILYGQPPQGAPELGSGLTNFLLKPLSGQTLIDTIAAMGPGLASGSVLIVDDDPQARTMYQELIGRALPRHSVRMAAGGAAALALLAEATPSLVILDLMMPDIDGFSVLEQLRARPQTRRVPVIVMSGHPLSLEDIGRLDHAHVTFQSKGILAPDEVSAALQRALAGDDALPPATSLLVKHAISYIQQHYRQALSRHELASAIGVSKDYLSHIFHQELGISPWDFLNRYRVRQAKQLLRSTSHSITEIAALAGFDDLSYFSRVFARHAGCSPRAYREQAE